MSSPLKIILLFLFSIGAITAQAQAVVPFVEHWDSLKTIKKSEGLFVSGREWGEWSFFDRQFFLMAQKSSAALAPELSIDKK